MTSIGHTPGRESAVPVATETLPPVLDLLPDGALLVDAAGVITYANVRVEQIFGYGRDELVGAAVEVLLPVELADGHARERARYASDPRPRPMGALRDLVGRHKDGSLVPIEVSLNALRGPEPRVLAIVRDVTEQRQAAEELRAWGDFFQHVELGVIIGAADTRRIERVNPAFARMHGYEPEELVGRDILDVFAPQVRARIPKEIRLAHERGHHVYESLHVRKDGSVFPVRIDVTAVKDERGRVRYRAVHVEDLTQRKRDEATLRRQSAVVTHMTEAVALVRDADGLIVFTNRAWERMFGYAPGEMVGLPIHVANAPTSISPEETARQIFAAVNRDGSWQGEVANVRKDGTRFWSDVTVTAFDDPEFGKVWLTVQSDITERKAAASALRDSEARFRTVFEQGPLGMAIADRDTAILQANAAFSSLLDLPAQGITGRRLLDLVPEKNRAEDAAGVTALFTGERARLRIERPFTDRAGRVRWAQVTASALPHEPPAEPLMLAMVEDVTARKEAQDKLAHLAMHDELTGLPNRAFVKDRLRQAQLRTERSKEFIAVLFLDLDGFKEINDALGHEVGDLVLIQVGRRLRECLRPTDTAARLGGDEFLLACDPLSGDPAIARREAAAIARRVADVLSEPVRLRDHELRLTASMGIVLEQGATQTASALIGRADHAMYRAKANGRSYQFYDEQLELGGTRMEAEESALREALGLGQLEVHYQPVIDLRNEVVLGFEALVRWRHPQRGLLLPEEFLDTAERSGLIVPIGAFVLRTAVAQLAEWTRSREEPLFMAVNVSTQQLGEHGFGSLVAATLAEHALPADRLHLEIAEGRFIEATGKVLAELESLRALGVHVGLDDFGTGWSSLTRLQRFPVDFLKLDRSFVIGVERNSANAAIVEAVVGLGRALDLEIVPEGVERSEEAGVLESLGCRRAQGWLFGRAAPAWELPGAMRR